MTPTAATARAPQAAGTSFGDRLKDASLLRDRCYIDGAWVGTPSRPVTNPVNGLELAKVPIMSTAETTQAVEAAERAFPAWARLTAKQRSNILRKWFELIAANREDLALILTSEQGKPLSEALGEVDISGAYVEFFAEEGRRVYGETIPTQRADARLLAAEGQRAARRMLLRGRQDLGIHIPAVEPCRAVSPPPPVANPAPCFFRNEMPGELTEKDLPLACVSGLCGDDEFRSAGRRLRPGW